MHPRLPHYRDLEGMAETAASNLTEVAEVVATTMKGLATAGLEVARGVSTTAAPTVTEATRAVLASTTSSPAGPGTYFAATTASSLPTFSSTTRVAEQCQVT